MPLPRSASAARDESGRRLSPRAMIVCLCNGISDRNVRELAAAGATKVSEIYQQFGSKPRCGQCVPHLCAALRKSSDTMEPSSLLPVAVAAE